MGSVVLAAGVITAALPAQAEAPSTATTAPASADGQCAAQADGRTPSLAVQDACGDHAMGSSQATDSATAAPAPTAGPQARSLAATPPTASPSSSYVKGVDVSWYQGLNTNWTNLAANGYKFTFIKATESTSYVNSYFQQQWANARSHGFLRGAYDFGRPDLGGAAAEAQYFYAHGASLAVGQTGTLPPVLDIEETPGGACSGISQAAMVSWISTWVSTIKGLTGRTPIIYTRAGWWSQCTGGNTTIGKSALLWVADWTTGRTSPALPSGWGTWSFWQYSDAVAIDANAGDADVFNSAFNRIAGDDRFATSVEVSKSFSAGGTVYLASGAQFPDSLSASAAAGISKSPVLLVSANSVPSTVAARLAALKPAKIIVIGGSDAVHDSVLSSVSRYTQSGSAASVQRESGLDRYETSAAVATTNFSKGVGHVYVASGEGYPDALSASAVAAESSKAGPLLLVTRNAIPATVATALSKLQPASITVLGGPDVISQSVIDRLKTYTTGAVTSFAGNTRYGTGQQIAVNEFSPGVAVAYVASGTNFPDALVGGPLAALSNAPVLMTLPGSTPAETAQALTYLKPKKIVVLGGANAITPAEQLTLQGYAAG